MPNMTNGETELEIAVPFYLSMHKFADSVDEKGLTGKALEAAYDEHINTLFPTLNDKMTILLVLEEFKDSIRMLCGPIKRLTKEQATKEGRSWMDVMLTEYDASTIRGRDFNA